MVARRLQLPHPLTPHAQALAGALADATRQSFRATSLATPVQRLAPWPA
jgi:hypothetical protein